MREEHKSLIETKEFKLVLRSKANKKFADTSNDNTNYLAYLSKYASKYVKYIIFMINRMTKSPKI
jgi:NADPH-dependent 7-cyano-7-deazaguanine reductase QueF-like protein